MTWLPTTTTPREGEDLVLKLNIEGHQKIYTGYYMKGSFWLEDERFQENSQYITHYQYSKDLL